MGIGSTVLKNDHINIQNHKDKWSYQMLPCTYTPREGYFILCADGSLIVNWWWKVISN